MKHKIVLEKGFFTPISILQFPMKHAQRDILCILMQLEDNGETLDYTNKAFGKFLNLDARSISRHLNDLEELGLISLCFDLAESERKIYITEKARKLQKGGK